MNGGHKFVRCTKCIFAFAKQPSVSPCRVHMLKATNECPLLLGICKYVYALAINANAGEYKRAARAIAMLVYMDNIFYSREICRHCYFYDWHNCCFTLPPFRLCSVLRALCQSNSESQRSALALCCPTLASVKIKLNWWNYCEYDRNSIDSKPSKFIASQKMIAKFMQCDRCVCGANGAYRLYCMTSL